MGNKAQGVDHKIKTVEQVSRSAVRNSSAIIPSWFKRGVEAALLAPATVNQQKYFSHYVSKASQSAERSFEYVGMSNSRHRLRAKKGFSMIGYTLMDLGIAKYHFEIGAGKVNFDWI